jgi:acetoin utilization deacetylase AcuC-like enzyme
MSFVLITSDRFADHVTPPGHPERVERAETMQVVAAKWVEKGGSIVKPREAADDDLARIHDRAYIASIGKLRGRAAMLDPDTFTSPESDEVARLAAGAMLTAIDHAVDGKRAFAMVRPPGHHAEADRAMGFCLYNNVAVGAAYARQRGSQRVAIVDYDVHHGNGTQHSFYRDRSVLYISSHQYPFYPGTGAAHEIGAGEGTGFTVNIPLEAGCMDADYDLVFRSVVVPVLNEFKPDLILVSAGFDAHVHDPLAGMRLTAQGYGRLTAALLKAADDLCKGRIAFITEGGYDLPALAECMQMVIDLSVRRTPLEPTLTAGSGTARAEAALKEVRAAQKGYWKGL